MLRLIHLSLLFLVVLRSTPAAQADSLSFNQNYDELEEWLLEVTGEISEVENFVYKKDAATFNFDKGKFLLRRQIKGRPTVAVFVGNGRVSIDIPSHVERQSLLTITGDSTVITEFDVCYIRFADNFDLELKSNFDFRPGSLTAKEARQAKHAQGDYFFKPISSQILDNYFQLLRSAYNRQSDGFF